MGYLAEAFGALGKGWRWQWSWRIWSVILAFTLIVYSVPVPLLFLLARCRRLESSPFLRGPELPATCLPGPVFYNNRNDEGESLLQEFRNDWDTETGTSKPS